MQLELLSVLLSALFSPVLVTINWGELIVVFVFQLVYEDLAGYCLRYTRTVLVPQQSRWATSIQALEIGWPVTSPGFTAFKLGGLGLVLSPENGSDGGSVHYVGFCCSEIQNDECAASTCHSASVNEPHSLFWWRQDLTMCQEGQSGCRVCQLPHVPLISFFSLLLSVSITLRSLLGSHSHWVFSKWDLQPATESSGNSLKCRLLLS